MLCYAACPCQVAGPYTLINWVQYGFTAVKMLSYDAE